MALKVGEIQFNVAANTAPLQTDLGRVKTILASTQAQVGAGGGILGAGLMGGIGGAAVGMLTGLVGKAIDAGRAIVNLSSEAEQAAVSFTVMLGSGQKAQAMLDKIQDFAKTTPFGSAELQAAAKTMLGFGMSAQSIMPNLRRLGDVAGGNGERLKSLALVFGQIQAAGKLTGGDLLQLVNIGFNPLQTISEKTGKSIGDLRKEMESGGITAQMVTDAFAAATGEGGRFHGMMSKMSKTFSGQWSAMWDNLSELGRQLGKLILPGLTTYLKNLNEGLEIIIAFGERLKAGLAPVLQSVGGMFAPMIAAMDKANKYLTSLIDFRVKPPDTQAWDDYVEKIEASHRAIEDLDKKQTDAMTKQNDELKKQAAEITASLQSPMEKAAEKLAQYQDLFGRGLLSPETLEAGTKKLLEGLDSALGKAKEFRAAMDVPEIGAADVRFSEGQRLQSAYNANIVKLEMAEKAGVEEQRRTNTLLTQLLAETKKKQPLNIKKVSAP